jgi:hypothetical protein
MYKKQCPFLLSLWFPNGRVGEKKNKTPTIGEGGG